MNTSEKYALTIKESSDYFNIGEKKIRRMVEDFKDAGWYFYNGTKVLIKRKLFESFLNQVTSI